MYISLSGLDILYTYIRTYLLTYTHTYIYIHICNHCCKQHNKTGQHNLMTHTLPSSTKSILCFLSFIFNKISIATVPSSASIIMNS